MINEATLEARIHSELKKIFPTLAGSRIKHQKTFTLKFGHHDILVDGFSKASAGGRLDILIELDNKPLAVIELKREGEILSDDDRDQGISYARLLTPMPPIVIVSNGNDGRFYRTYNKEEWKPENDNIDEKIVQELFKHASTCASVEHDEAIRLLLGQQPDIWTQIIRKYTAKVLEELEGEISDFTLPISKNFQIKRTVASTISNLITSGEKLIALVGPPLSGKTNVIYQICHSNEFSDIVPLYIDISSTSYGILRVLANKFAHSLYINSTPDDVRHWLMHGLRHAVDGRLVIIIDGWSVNAKERNIADVQELIGLTMNSNVSIVFAVNNTTFEEISTEDGRPTRTEIGRSARVVELFSMDDNEFNHAKEYIEEQFDAIFCNGSQYNTEFRFPGLLRLLVSDLPLLGSKNTLIKKEGYKSVNTFESVTNIKMLKSVWEKFVSNSKLRSDLTYLVKAYLADKGNRKVDPFLSVISYGRGHIIHSTAEEVMGESRLERLTQQGFVQLVNGRANAVWVLPKVPMLLSAAAAYYIADIYMNILSDEGFEEAYKYFIKESEIFPYSDLVAANAVIEISKRNEDALTEIIYRLVKSPPKKEIKYGRSKALVSISEIEATDIEFEENEEQILISNLHPWLVLSQIACMPLGDVKGNRDIHLKILAELGAYPDLLRRIDIVPLKDMKELHFHDIEGRGSILCGKVGIIEPIISAMNRGFYEMPDEMLRICEFAKEEDEYFLAWRLSKSATVCQTLANERASNAAKQAVEILGPVINAKVGNSQPVKQDSYSKVGRNELCPCRSGKKYKRCHGR